MKTLDFFRAACLAMPCIFAPFAFAAEVPQNTTEQTVMLDINQADAASIASALEGIGPAKAKEIVAYREMFGSFRTLDELLEVPGVGAVTLEKNRSRILIQGN